MTDESAIALVTGAARGIGYEVCRQLAVRGWTVVLTARSLDRAREAAEGLARLDGKVHPRALDVNDEASARALAADLGWALGRIDVLVNNAAEVADWQETAGTADLRAARAMLDTNLFGAWRTTQALLPLLRRSRRGRIINVSSGAGSHGDPRFGLSAGPAMASYAISKAALNALTVKLALELQGDGILVNAVCPGLTATAPGMEEIGARPVSEGAASVVWAALLPGDGPTGGFFRDGRQIPW
ncbi:MAG TPA: SDR family NAD(P)-dependent oxidoreductase [Gemmatimonadales bacterium]|nr:SDR family NAD(P)-dependent oxidoreductase [Gemmatimonadales bacterium]